MDVLLSSRRAADTWFDDRNRRDLSVRGRFTWRAMSSATAGQFTKTAILMMLSRLALI